MMVLSNQSSQSLDIKLVESFHHPKEHALQTLVPLSLNDIQFQAGLLFIQKTFCQKSIRTDFTNKIFMLSRNFEFPNTYYRNFEQLQCLTPKQSLYDTKKLITRLDRIRPIASLRPKQKIILRGRTEMDALIL